MYWSNRSLFKNISWRKSFSPYLACHLKIMGRNSKIFSHKKIWAYGEYAWMVKKVWRAFKLAVESYCIFDQ